MGRAKIILDLLIHSNFLEDLITELCYCSIDERNHMYIQSSKILIRYSLTSIVDIRTGR